MKKTIKWILLLILLIIIGFAAFLYLNPKKGLRVIIPDLDEIENIHVTLLQDTALIDIDMKLENKGLFKLDIDSLGYHIRFDTATLLSESRFLGLELKRGQEDTVRLTVLLPYKRLQKKIEEVQGQDSVDIPIDVRLVYSTIFGKTILPYSKTIRIEVPHPPKFEVESIDYLSREKKTGYFMAHVLVHNYGKIDLNISALNYKLTVKNLLTASGTEDKQIRIRPHSDLRVQIPIRVEFESLLKTLGHVILKDRVNYHLEIKALLQNDKLGRKQAPIDVEKEGTMVLRK